jgi:hypothetical protein
VGLQPLAPGLQGRAWSSWQTAAEARKEATSLGVGSRRVDDFGQASRPQHALPLDPGRAQRLATNASRSQEPGESAPGDRGRRAVAPPRGHFDQADEQGRPLVVVARLEVLEALLLLDQVLEHLRK